MMPPDTFNTGLMVVRPSHALHNRVMNARGSVSSYDGSDQGFLNSLFADWFATGHRLPFHFNVLQSISWFYPPAWDRMMTSMKLLHFCGDASMKPWSYTQKLSGSLAKYVYLWQRVSWMEELDDVRDFMWVLQLTDDKVPMPPPPPPPPLTHCCHRKFSSFGRRRAALGLRKDVE
jgi:hypothetical protein